jgi:uncharacterized protein YndB with AHSA1/START domain
MTTTEPVVVVRRLAASPERLFEAWTDPVVLVRWFVTAENQQVAEAEMDVRPGGEYRITITDPEDRFCAFGTYQRVEPPHLLEFTWEWEESSIEKGRSLVTVELRPLGRETELTLTHARLASEKSIQAHASGWTAILDRLVTFVSTP